MFRICQFHFLTFKGTFSSISELQDLSAETQFIIHAVVPVTVSHRIWYPSSVLMAPSSLFLCFA